MTNKQSMTHYDAMKRIAKLKALLKDSLMCLDGAVHYEAQLKIRGKIREALEMDDE